MVKLTVKKINRYVSLLVHKITFHRTADYLGHVHTRTLEMLTLLKFAGTLLDFTVSGVSDVSYPLKCGKVLVCLETSNYFTNFLQQVHICYGPYFMVLAVVCFSKRPTTYHI